MRKADLLEHPLFPLLNESEQKWILAYREHRDARLATQMVVGPQKVMSELRRLTMSYLGVPALHKLVAWIDGEYQPTNEEIIAELWKFGTKRKGSDNAKVAALQTIAEAKGMIKGKQAGLTNKDLAEVLAKVDKGYSPKE